MHPLDKTGWRDAGTLACRVETLLDTYATLRPIILHIALIAAMLPGLRAQELQLTWDGAQLHVNSPQLHFLTGKALDRMKNGNAVAFDFQLSATSNGSVIKRTLERFVISYDLWEERFAVTRLARDKAPRKSASHLTQAAAETWCLENIPLSTDGIDPGRSVLVQLEIRAEDPRESNPILGEPGISLTALIEIFSRPTRGQQPKWNLQRGPLRLTDLNKRPARTAPAPPAAVFEAAQASVRRPPQA